MRLHMMCPDAMCRRAPVSISKGIAIKTRVMIRQHTEIDLVRLKPDPTVTMDVAHRPMAAITVGAGFSRPFAPAVIGSALASVHNTAARTYGG